MFKLLAVFIALAHVHISSGSGSEAIDYEDQENWGGVCNKKTSKKQSPVDVILPKKSTSQKGALIELSGKLLQSEAVLTLYIDPKQPSHIERKKK